MLDGSMRDMASLPGRPIIRTWPRQPLIRLIEQEEREKLLERIKARLGIEEYANGVEALEAGEIMATALTEGSKQ
jgi:hypothetical protein